MLGFVQAPIAGVVVLLFEKHARLARGADARPPIVCGRKITCLPYGSFSYAIFNAAALFLFTVMLIVSVR